MAADLGISFYEPFEEALRKFRLMAERDPAFRKALPGLLRKTEEWNQRQKTLEMRDVCALLPGAERLFPNEDDRLAAAGRVLDRLGRFIHPKRWPLIAKNLTQQGRRAAAKTRDEALQALFFVGETAGDCYTVEDAQRALRSRLNEVVTIAILGPEWRRGKRTETEDGAALSTPPADVAQLEARLAVEALVARARLTQREAEVVEAYMLTESFAEAARRLNIKESTARGHGMRAREKLRNAAW